jgi:hypothetical protein
MRGLPYEDVLNPRVWSRLRARLSAVGRLAISLTCGSPWDPPPDRVDAVLEKQELDVWIFDDVSRDGQDGVISGSARSLNNADDGCWKARRRWATQRSQRWPPE